MMSKISLKGMKEFHGSPIVLTRYQEKITEREISNFSQGLGYRSTLLNLQIQI